MGADTKSAPTPPEHAGRGAGNRGARGAAVAAAPRPGRGPAPSASAASGGAAGRRGRAVFQRPMQLEGEVSLAERPRPNPPGSKSSGTVGSAPELGPARRDRGPLSRPSSMSPSPSPVPEQKSPRRPGPCPEDAWGVTSATPRGLPRPAAHSSRAQRWSRVQSSAQWEPERAGSMVAPSGFLPVAGAVRPRPGGVGQSEKGWPGAAVSGTERDPR